MYQEDEEQGRLPMSSRARTLFHLFRNKVRYDLVYISLSLFNLTF